MLWYTVGTHVKIAVASRVGLNMVNINVMVWILSFF